MCAWNEPNLSQSFMGRMAHWGFFFFPLHYHSWYSALIWLHWKLSKCRCWDDSVFLTTSECQDILPVGPIVVRKKQFSYMCMCCIVQKNQNCSLYMYNISSTYTENMLYLAASKIWILKWPKKLVVFYRGSFLFCHWKAVGQGKGVLGKYGVYGHSLTHRKLLN